MHYEAITLPGLSVPEMDPTGAGDTFAGTMLGALGQGMALHDAAEFAVQRSALVITQGGPAAILALVS